MENGMNKHCPDCEREKPIYAFGIDRSRSDGLNLYCRTCIRKKRQETRQKTPHAKPKPPLAKTHPNQPLQKVKWAIESQGVKSRTQLIRLLRGRNFCTDDIMDCYAILRDREEVRRIA